MGLALYDCRRLCYCVCHLIVQAQALLVGLLAALFAVILGWVPEGKFSIIHGLLLAVSSVLTAGIASFVLGMTATCYSPLLFNKIRFYAYFMLTAGFPTLCLSYFTNGKLLFLLSSLLRSTSTLHSNSGFGFSVSVFLYFFLTVTTFRLFSLRLVFYVFSHSCQLASLYQ